MNSILQEQAGLPILESKNLKRLSESETMPYLSGIEERLDNLSAILKREGDEFVASYVNIIKNSVECLELKYQLQGEDKIDFPLTIIPEESGFPTEKDFYLLEKNKEEAAEVLKMLPEKTEIINKIRNAILRDSSYANAQIMLRRHNFYSKLSESNLLEGYHLKEAKFVGREAERKRNKNGSRRKYTLEWTCIERDSKFPFLYRMCLTQDERHPPLDKVRNPRLETVIYQTQIRRADLAAFAMCIDNEIEEVHPKLLERYKIGPFYNSLTENPIGTNEILQKEEGSSILKFEVERVVSERVGAYGTWFEKLIGKKAEREIFGPVDSETRIIAPFRIKQELSGKDEYGNSCKIYGVTKEGKIIG